MPLGLNRSYRNLTLLITCAAALSACNQPSEETAKNDSNPSLACAFALAPSDDSSDCVAIIVSSLSLEQKIGQMIQGEIRDVTPDDVRDFYLGSVLNGGGGFPSNNNTRLSRIGSNWQTIITTPHWIRRLEALASRLFGVLMPFTGITTSWVRRCFRITLVWVLLAIVS